MLPRKPRGLPHASAHPAAPGARTLADQRRQPPETRGSASCVGHSGARVGRWDAAFGFSEALPQGCRGQRACGRGGLDQQAGLADPRTWPRGGLRNTGLPAEQPDGLNGARGRVLASRLLLGLLSP